VERLRHFWRGLVNKPFRHGLLEKSAKRTSRAPPAYNNMEERVRELNGLCRDFQNSNPGLDVNVAMQAAIAAFKAGSASSRSGSSNDGLRDAEERRTSQDFFRQFLTSSPPGEKHFAEIFLYDKDGNILGENPNFFDDETDTRQYKEACIGAVRSVAASILNSGQITRATYKTAMEKLKLFLYNKDSGK
jgi:hypothetical protein